MAFLLLLSSVDLQTAVDALARARAIESSHIGVAGQPSAIYALWAEVEKRASQDDSRALLKHESAVVRGYAVKHVIRTGDASLAAALLEDDAVVTRRDGCMEGDSTIAELVAEAAEDARHQGLLLAVARRPWPRRYKAMTALIDLTPFCKELEQTKSVEAVRLLARCPGALPVIEQRIDSWFRKDIVAAAKTAYRMHPDAQLARVKALGVDKGALADLARSDNPDILAFLVEQLCLPGVDKYNYEMLAVRTMTPNFRAAMERLQACDNPRAKQAAAAVLTR